MNGKQKSRPRNPAGRNGSPVSLYPLSFKEAVAGLAQVKMPEPESKKPKTKPAKGQNFRLNSPEVWYTIQPAKAYRYGGKT